MGRDRGRVNLAGSSVVMALLYVGFCTFWILAFDSLVPHFFDSYSMPGWLQQFKLAVFFLVSGLFVCSVYKWSFLPNREMELYNRMLFEESIIGLALSKMSGELVDVNSAYSRIIGRSIDETLELSYWDITPQRYADDEALQLKSLVEHGYHDPYEKEFIHKDGHSVSVRLKGQVVWVKGEQMIWSSVEDISEQKRKQDNFNRLFEMNRDGYVINKGSGEILSPNPAYAKMLGYTVDELLGLSWKCLTPQSWLDWELENHGAQLVERGFTDVYEKEYIRKDGSTFPVEVQAYLLNKPERLEDALIAAFVRDITIRKNEALEQERNRLLQEVLLECIGDGIIACDSDGRLSYFNQAAKDFHGLPQEPISVEDWADHYDLYDADGKKRLEMEKVPLFRALKGEEVVNQEIVICPENRPKRVMICTGRKLVDSNDIILGAVISMNDITERKKLEEREVRRRKQVSNYNQILTEMIREPDFISGDFNGLLATLNEKISNVLNISRVSGWHLTKSNTNISLVCVDLWDTRDGSHTNGMCLDERDYSLYFESLMTDRTLIIDDVFEDSRTKELRETYIRPYQITSMLAAPFHFSGDIAGVLCLEQTSEVRHWQVEEEAFVISAADILSIAFETAKRKELELTLQRAEKLDALGKLTGGVAHDYNNMLGVIIGYAELLEKRLQNDDKLFSYAQTIHRAGKRGAKLTSKLLAFSRQRNNIEQEIDVNKLILDSQHMLEKTLTVRVRLDFDLEKDLWRVWLDSSDLEDVILNLSINAMHAITGKGSLVFRTRNEHINAHEALLLNLSEGEYVTLSVVDTGCGMDEQTRNKIFEPFFSTKGEKGTGLGLSQVYGFVQGCGGAIKVYSELGNGTRFVLYFPKYSMPGSEKKIEQESFVHTESSGTVLVVDDEKDLLSLTCEILESNGYKVFGAERANEALEILRHHKIDVLITDIIMPDMDGYELAKKVFSSYPNIKIQLMSGFADGENMALVEEHLYQNILQKPFASKELLQRIKTLMEF